MMAFIHKYLYAIIGAVVLALLVALGVQTVRLHKAKADHAKTKANHARVLADLASKTKKVYEAVIAADKAVRNKLAKIDETHYKELSHEQAENKRLRAAVRNGTASVRIKGNCVGHTDTMPQTASTRNMGDGATTVDANLSERVFNLRAEVIQAEKQIAYLQEYAMLCQKGAN